MSEYQIIASESVAEIADLRSECHASLTCPPDGMWESFRAQSQVWIIRWRGQVVGYALVDDAQQLLQFYLQAKHLPARLAVFSALLEEAKVKSGIVGTHQPVFHSTALHFIHHVQVHTYLFRQMVEQTETVEPRPGQLIQASTTELEQLVSFCHYSVGAPQAWLQTYLQDLIARQALFYWRLEDTMVGTCEVRNNLSAPAYADIGMIISPDFRRQGYGTFLLAQAKNIAKERSLQPICSCETGNVGSLKAIQTNGFRSLHQLMAVNFTGRIS